MKSYSNPSFFPHPIPGYQQRGMAVAAGDGVITTANTTSSCRRGDERIQIRQPNRQVEGRRVSEPDGTLRCTTGRIGRPRLLAYLVLAMAIASGEAALTGGSSSHYPNSNGDYGEHGGHSRGLVASGTLCPPKCKCLPNKQVSPHFLSL